MQKKGFRMNLPDANHAAIRERPTAAEEQTAAGERCMMQYVLNAELILRCLLSQGTTDQSIAVTATRQEGNPQARIP